ncbi:hypothetical protein [Tropicibacter naphthalenivorans]|uniref:Porin domain-containing protein n=1 Tax=Tropicibacter naphthalenivorans TaxID=441103 RepID=A0A0P1GLF0_9RHOB|nr:hypothetical protein [Tropicibacter naphthalenivorans]CUH76212.1 hypothetical protein TRN7648_00836 [Tropicibacter naphthalenivorans]SMC39382.1 hypothetical protein SAMN04488093_10148 [Tropicibacter naphthalenivorans]
MRHALIALFLAPLAAQAQSLDVTGRIALGATDAYAHGGIGTADVTLSLPITQSAPLGFEMGTYLFARDGKRPHETYAAFVWNDQWRAGVVRPAYDSVLTSVFERSAPFLAYTRAEFTRAETTTAAMRRTAVPWGLSFTNTANGLGYAVSIHDASKGDFRSASVALTQGAGAWQIAAAIEGVWSRNNTYDGINAKLGAQYDAGGLRATIAYLHPDANNRPDAIALSAQYDWTKLSVGVMGEFTDAGQDDAYGLSAEVRLGGSTGAILSATDGAAGPAWHLTLDHQF